jgi:hypothetical protein
MMMSVPSILLHTVDDSDIYALPSHPRCEQPYGSGKDAFVQQNRELPRIIVTERLKKFLISSKYVWLFEVQGNLGINMC